MSWYKNNNSIITLKFVVADLYTKEDYEILSSALKEIEGVEDIGDFYPQQITVTFDQNQTSVEYIVYKISIMGYRYLNRL